MATRQDPRPRYYSPESDTEIQISYEFESYLIQVGSATISDMIARLRKSVQGWNRSAVVADLTKQALDIDAGDSAALKQELSSQLGDMAGTAAQEAPEVNEMQMISTAIAEATALPWFRYQEANYGVTYSGLLKESLTNDSSVEARKRELRSWIDCLRRYL